MNRLQQAKARLRQLLAAARAPVSDDGVVWIMGSPRTGSTWLVNLLGADAMRWIVGLSFIAMALWALVPDSAPEENRTAPRYGVFLTTIIAFFLVEMGDKTQIATVALAAQFQALTMVVLGTTLGMLLANVPVVFAGDALLRRVPLKVVRIAAALTFVALGVYALLSR